MSTGDIDVLMITYNRPEYTRLSLQRLLDSCDDSMRVWVWHNGNHGETLEIVRSLVDRHPVHEFHHSPENQRLRAPTNWLWSQARGRYLSKVDDDILVPDGWAQTLRAAHEADSKLGVVGCWSFRPEDHKPELAKKKVITIGDGCQILQNCWIEGAGHLIKRQCIEEAGLLKEKQSFTNYCIHLAARGWINGWYYPFIYMENMNDPRSPYTEIKTEADFQARRGLSANKWGVSSLEESRRRQPLHALKLQTCSTNPWHYIGFRGRLRRLLNRLRPGEHS